MYHTFMFLLSSIKGGLADIVIGCFLLIYLRVKEGNAQELTLESTIRTILGLLFILLGIMVTLTFTIIKIFHL